MTTVKMQYHGPAHKLNRTIQLPVPFTQHSVKEGTVEFKDGFGEVPKAYVEAFEALGVFTIALPSKEAGKEEVCSSSPKHKSQK